MKRSRNADDIGTIRIEMAARYGKPGAPVDASRDTHLLHILSVRDVPLPEPVDVTVINGRQPVGWEQDEIRAARERERRAEWRP